MTWAQPQQLALLADPIDERFLEFHHANPHVYRRLVAMAREWKDAGHDACSIKMLVEVLRWQGGVQTDRRDGLLINNSFTSRYARLIAANEPDLAPLFTTRTLRSDWDAA
jgi:vacuolar-type H+-ATPase subunit E/Vma4